MDLSNMQREGIRKIKEGLEDLLQDQFFALYGDNGDEVVIQLKQYARDYIDQSFSNTIELFNNYIKNIDTLNSQVHKLENVIKPDETDVHNINRRIEILAQRIAQLESNQKKWRWPFERGGIIK